MSQCLNKANKMKNKQTNKYHAINKFSKSNRKIMKTEAKSIPNT